MAAVALLIPVVDLGPLGGIILLFGAADGVAFAVLYAIPVGIPEIPVQGLPLAIGTIDSVRTLVGSGIALGFGLIVGLSGFGVAWATIGVVAAVPLLLLAWVHARRSF